MDADQKRVKLDTRETADILNCLPVLRRLNGYVLRFHIGDYGQECVSMDDSENCKEIYLPPEGLRSRTGVIEVKPLNLIVEYER